MKRTATFRRLAVAATCALYCSAVPLGAWAVNKCCKVIPNSSQCSGCRLIGLLPTRYVNVGNNSIKDCVDATVTSLCDEEPLPCYSANGVDLYSDASCQNKIGTGIVTINASQCANNDDWCPTGG